MQTKIHRWLLAATLFTSSLLLFLIQPMVAKILVPKLGGAAGVWSYCLLFFQTTLLLGYLYSFGMRRYIPPKTQVLIHIFLCCLAIFAPISFGNFSKLDSASFGTSFLQVFAPLTLPLVLIASLSTLFQSWIIDQNRFNTGSKHSPYLLYVISNLACLLALGGYLVFGGLSSLHVQWDLWVSTYQGLMIITACIACYQFFRWKEHTKSEPYFRNNKVPIESCTEPKQQKKWALAVLAESAVPAALLCALSTYLTTWTASIPTMWLIPLSLYLIAYMLAFSNLNPLPGLIEKAWPTAASIAVIVYILGHKVPAPIVLTVHLSAFFLICMGLHKQVYRSRPLSDNKQDGQESKLSFYYLLIAIGSVAGSLLATLVAPHIFDSFYEVPAAYVLARLVYNPIHKKNHKVPAQVKTQLKWVPLYLFGVWLWVSFNKSDLNIAIDNLSYIIWLPLLLALAFRRPKPILIAATGYFLLLSHQLWQEKTLFHDRSLYAPISVKQVDSQMRELVNGETIHGRQNLSDLRTPLSYYHRKSGMGLFLKRFGPELKDIAMVGLGVGTISTYLEKGQSITYFEIDPEIISLAQKENLFTFVSDAEKRGVHNELVLGDARLSLESWQKPFDSLLLDAFQSSSIPVHLMTREALAIYDRQINAGGVLLFHISNKYLDFESVLAAHGRGMNWPTYILRTGKFGPGMDPASWVAMIKPAKHKSIKTYQDKLDWFDKNWKAVSPKRKIQMWTDQKANLMEIML